MAALALLTHQKLIVDKVATNIHNCVGMYLIQRENNATSNGNRTTSLICLHYVIRPSFAALWENNTQNTKRILCIFLGLGVLTDTG